MSTPNLNYSNLDSRYTKPSDVDTKIAAQATTDAGQYAKPSSMLNAQTLRTNQDKALLRARADMMTADTKRFNALFVGHSMVGGYRATSYKDMLHNAFNVAARRKVGLAASGSAYFPAIAQQYDSSDITDYPASVKTAPSLTEGNGGIPINSGTWIGTFNGTTYGSLVIPVPQGVSQLGIWCGTTSSTAASSYKYQYQIDAGSQVIIDHTADTVSSNSYRHLDVVALDGNAHTITLTGPTNSTLMSISGFEYLNSDATTGFHSFWHSQPGQTTTQMMTSLSYTNSIALSLITPSVLVFTGLCNDYSSGATGANPVPSATTATNLPAIINNIVAACGSKAPSVIINVENQRNNSDGSMTEPWQNYVNVAYQVAAANGWAIYDGGKHLGGGAPVAATSLGLLNSDQIHPTSAGMRVWGGGLVELIASGN